ILGITTVAAWVLAIFGARFGLAALIERAYAATTVLAAGAWMAAATALSPLTSPLPQALAIGAVILSVPWWAHRRRRARVRVEHKLQAWPDIAKTAETPPVVLAAVGRAGCGRSDAL